MDSVYAFPTFHDGHWVLVVEEQHSLYRASHRQAGLWLAQWYSTHALSHYCGICTSFSHLFPFFFCITSHDDIQMEHLCQAGPTTVLLLALLIYLGQSMPTALMASLRSMQWATTQMSWVTFFLRVHEQWVLVHSLPFPSFYFLIPFNYLF